MIASWHGTPAEHLELMRAFDRNCECQFGDMGEQQSRCAAHRLTESQRALDGLLYARRIARTLRDEEWRAQRPLLWAERAA